MNHRHTDHHDDIMGIITTGLAGNNQWGIANIGNTGYALQFLRNNSSDYYNFHAQSPHWRKHNAALDSIHIHYMLKDAYTAAQTLVFDIYWAWIIPGTIFPSDIANWNKAENVQIILNANSNLSAYYTDIFPVVVDVPPPVPDGYGIGIAVKLIRKNGSFTGDMWVWFNDAHALKDKEGSLFEYTDEL